jgi:tRNA(Ile)-lysidine synthase
MKSPSAAGAIAIAPIVAVACSGGSDSAAALLETRRLAPRAEVVACYVDHGARPRASIDRDIAAVRAQAHAVGARTLVAHLVWADPGAGASEATLRKARYRALSTMAKRVGASLIVTGHHAGDVAEWVLIAMMRGSGVDGLAVMPELRAVARGVTLVRPLLRESKSDLADAVRREHLPVSIDETNAQPRYARNVVRQFLAACSKGGASPEKTLARSAMLLADDRAALDALVRAELDRARSRGVRDALETRALREMPTAVLRRVVRMIVRDTAGAAIDFSLTHCEAIVRAIRARRGGQFHAGNARVLLSAGLLRVIAHARRSRPSIARPKGSDEIGPVHKVRLRAASVPAAPNLTLRHSVPGDTCVPSGRRNPVSLARFLAKEGVPRDQRASVPLLCVDGQIAAAIGIRVMEPFAPSPGEATVDITWRTGNLSGQANSTDIINMKHSSP